MAAQNATFTFLGQSGRTYAIDVYVPDAVNTQLTFNPNGLAGSTSPTTFRVPEACTLIDVSGAAPTAVGFSLFRDSGAITGGALRWANQLATLSNRQKLNIGFPAGSFVSAVQF